MSSSSPFDKYVVRHDDTIRGAMESLQRGAVEICLVVDDQQRVVGCMTDGDVRRALLDGFGMESPMLPHIQQQLVSVSPEVGRAEVLDLMRTRVIEQIPVLDSESRLQGLHLLRELLGAQERPSWAVIMAGGRGERLRPLTDSIPKPMVLVAGRPILERIVLHLVGYGIHHIYLAIGYKGEQIEKHFGDGGDFGCRISYLREDQPLGTGGPLSLLPDRPEHPQLVLNADLVTQFDVGQMLSRHDKRTCWSGFRRIPCTPLLSWWRIAWSARNQ